MILVGGLVVAAHPLWVASGSGGLWAPDELRLVSIAGRQMYLWRVVDDEGEVQCPLQARCDNAAALRKLLKNQGLAPTSIVTHRIEPTTPPFVIFVFPISIVGASGSTTGPKVRTYRADDESERCGAFELPAQPNVSFLATQPATTPIASCAAKPSM
jgi:hypothetical protein